MNCEPTPDGTKGQERIRLRVRHLLQEGREVRVGERHAQVLDCPPAW